ncbi:MAG: TspO/MBR family protein, partial [Ornithinimicrobium sp.]
ISLEEQIVASSVPGQTSSSDICDSEQVTARLIVALTMVAIVIVYAALSSYWTSRRPGWYASLPQPSWQPPDKVFGIIWPLNFVALGVASWVLGFDEPRVVAITFGVTLTASVVFALSWAYLFYVPHRLGMAAASLTLASLLSWLLVVIAFNSVVWVGVLLVPYAVWMTIASSLAWGYAHLVPANQRLKTRHSKRPAAEQTDAEASIERD